MSDHEDNEEDEYDVFNYQLTLGWVHPNEVSNYGPKDVGFEDDDIDQNIDLSEASSATNKDNQEIDYFKEVNEDITNENDAKIESDDGDLFIDKCIRHGLFNEKHHSYLVKLSELMTGEEKKNCVIRWRKILKRSKAQRAKAVQWWKQVAKQEIPEDLLTPEDLSELVQSENELDVDDNANADDGGDVVRSMTQDEESYANSIFKMSKIDQNQWKALITENPSEDADGAIEDPRLSEIKAKVREGKIAKWSGLLRINYTGMMWSYSMMWQEIFNYYLDDKYSFKRTSDIPKDFQQQIDFILRMGRRQRKLRDFFLEVLELCLDHVVYLSDTHPELVNQFMFGTHPDTNEIMTPLEWFNVVSLRQNLFSLVCTNNLLYPRLLPKVRTDMDRFNLETFADASQYMDQIVREMAAEINDTLLRVQFWPRTSNGKYEDLAKLRYTVHSSLQKWHKELRVALWAGSSMRGLVDELVQCEYKFTLPVWLVYHTNEAVVLYRILNAMVDLAAQFMFRALADQDGRNEKPYLCERCVNTCVIARQIQELEKKLALAKEKQLETSKKSSSSAGHDAKDSEDEDTLKPDKNDDKNDETTSAEEDLDD